MIWLYILHSLENSGYLFFVSLAYLMRSSLILLHDVQFKGVTLGEDMSALLHFLYFIYVFISNNDQYEIWGNNLTIYFIYFFQFQHLLFSYSNPYNDITRGINRSAGQSRGPRNIQTCPADFWQRYKIIQWRKDCLCNKLCSSNWRSINKKIRKKKHIKLNQNGSQT